MSNFSVVDGDIRLTTSGGGQLLHTDDQNRLKVVMDMVYAPHTLSGTDHTGQLSDDQVISSNVTQHESYIDHDNLLNYDIDEHRILNDSLETDINLWSAQKIAAEITTISGKLDDHNELNNLDYASAGHTGFSPDTHLHDDRYYTESEVDDLITASSGTPIHSELSNLDYASAGHTGFSPDTHLHDGRYYTETELNSGQLDNRYYTESEVDTISGSLSSEIDSDISTHTSNADAHHAESHTVASHSDTTATGAELETLTDGSETSLHIHDGRYYTESEVDIISGSLQTNIDSKPDTLLELTDTPSSYDNGLYLKSTVDGTEWATVSGGGGADHNIADHLDTSATGAELNTLTGNSIADTLHRHTELVASDGSPDPALSVDAVGAVTMSGTVTISDSLFFAGSGKIGEFGSGNRYAFFSLYGDDTNYGIRLVRADTGVNAYSQIAHNGTGDFKITAENAASLLLQTNNSTRLTITDGGDVYLTNGTGINEFSTDGTLAGDSDDAVPTEKAVKTYVDAAGGVSSSNDNVWSETQLYSDNSLTCASTTTWDMETYQNTYLLLTENTTLSGTIPGSNSGYYTVLIKNNGTYTLTLDSQFLTSEDETLSNTTTSGSYDLLGVYLNNGLLFATMSTNFL